MQCCKKNPTAIPLENNSTRKRILTAINVSGIFSIILFSFIYLQVNPLTILSAPVSMVRFLATAFFPPDFTHFARYFPAVLETVYFAVGATYISALVSFIFAVLMSKRITKNPFIRNITRYIVSIFRNIPVLIWVQLLIFIFGIGHLVGLIALTFASIGFLARSYAESMDDIADETLEAIRSTGATNFQVLVHGLLPEFAPAWLDWTLFSFEINIRISAILGIVGAGGIGTVIQTNLERRNFQTASALIITLVVMVLVTEIAVGYMRKRIK